MLRWARRFGAIEADDAVQEVLRRALEGSGLDRPPAYWMVAVRNESLNQQRWRRRNKTWSLEQLMETGFVLVEPHDSIPFATISASADRDWLLAYYSRTKHSGKDRVEAYRRRKRLKGAI